MSVLANIRNRTGLLLAVIAGGIFLFLIQDALRSATNMFGPQQNVVGEIAGETIETERFNALVNQFSNNYSQQQQKSPDENAMRSIRDQAWKQLIVEVAYTKEYENLGIVVTKGDNESEEVDMIQGRFIHPQIQQQFTNPETGQFDKQKLIQVLQNLADAPEDQQEYVQNWKNFEASLFQERQRSKYENLMLKSSYVTTAEAKRNYAAERDSAKVAYLYIPFNNIADSTIAVSDTELKSYLNENAKQFEVEAGRSFDYVAFTVQPSPEDINNTREKTLALKASFLSAENDTNFVRTRADNATPPRYMSYAELPYTLKGDSLALSNTDTIFGPYFENKKFTLYHIAEYKKSDTTKKATASHILVRNTTPEGQPLDETQLAESKAKAESLLARALAGEDFAELAKAESADGSAAKGGDLGEFKTGQMVKPFQDAVFKAKSNGVINEVIESQFGFHIINVTSKAVIDEIKPTYLVATIDKELYASRETRNNIYKTATSFWKNCNGTEAGFQAAVEADSSLNKEEAKNIVATALTFGRIQKGRQVVSWAYDDETSKGDVSEIFRLDDAFIVATITNSREKGKASVEDVREELEIAVRKQKKADEIVKVFEAHNSGDFHERMDAINASKGAGFATKNFQDLSINLKSNYVSGLGNEPIFVGTAFGMKADSWSEKIVGENGVYIVELKKKIETPEIADYTQQKTALAAQAGGYFAKSGIEKVIEQNSNVKDYRYKFY